MSHQAPFLAGNVVPIAAETSAPGWRRQALRVDAAWRLGPRPAGLMLAHRVALALGLPQRRLQDAAVPHGPFLLSSPAPLAGGSWGGGAGTGLAGPARDPLPPPPSREWRGSGGALRPALVTAAHALDLTPDWHGHFDPEAPALSLALHTGPGARPVWEASRLGALPILAAAARLDPGGPHLARAEALLAAWCAANPPFRGPNWACAQEAALRALHLALALALLDADRDPPPGSRALLALCAQRIAATPLYALAQDNNHPVSEAAGAFACALLLGRGTRRHAAALSARVARLVTADGGFAQVSPGYTRLLLDTLSVAEWLRRRAGARPFPAPLAERAAAAARWLGRITCPETGATPALGLEDGSAFADLALCGAGDSRASVARALGLFKSGDETTGVALVGMPPPLPSPSHEAGKGWGGSCVAPCSRTSGTTTWQTTTALALLRTGPLRFRPGQSDLLHLSLRHRAIWVIRDGGTGSYDPPEPWWWSALAGAAAHNAAVFDDTDPMPRAGRFLLARWSRVTATRDGAQAHHRTGTHHARRVTLSDVLCTIQDTLAGRFRRIAFHWRLAPADWTLTPSGAASPLATVAITADAPLRLALRPGWESPAYGRVAPVPVLRVEAEAPVSTVTTRIHLPP